MIGDLSIVHYEQCSLGTCRDCLVAPDKGELRMLRVMFTPLVLVFGGLGAILFRPIFFGAPSYRSELSPSARPGCARRNVSTKARARSCDTSFNAMLNAPALHNGHRYRTR
jgi:hypothetical protein